MATLRSSVEEFSAAPKSALPARKTTSRTIAKAIPIETGLPGSESYALTVKGDLYDLDREEVL
jgi:hypothetical protein